MAEVTVVAKARAKLGREADVERALKAVIGPTHREAGCRFYALHRGLEDRGVFVVIERWTSQDALDQHLATTHVRMLFGQLADLVAGPAEVVTFEHLPVGLAEKERLGSLANTLR